MKKYNLLQGACFALLMLASCDDFLDKLPDNRTEVDTPDKVAKILVSAYPDHSPVVINELASDNVIDNGKQYKVFNTDQEESYLWEPFTTIGNDSPDAVWDSHYHAIACANAALEGIKNMGDDESLNPYKGEALLCRAYAHFVMANTFCMAYNPQTASKEMGLPLIYESETTVAPHYERGTLDKYYEAIKADIEAGLPLIDDNAYDVPKYHFNQKAAYAFATRFYLFHHEYDKAIECANKVLGDNPVNVLRNWTKILDSARDFTAQFNMYVDDTDPANLLLVQAISTWPYIVNPYGVADRYALSKSILQNELIAGVWNGNIYYKNLYWGNTDQQATLAKMGAFFEYTDKAAGKGYLHVITNPFSTDETLLCRAEAYTLKGDLANAVNDINTWIGTHSKNAKTYTQQQIIDYYQKAKYTSTDNSVLTVKKHLNTQGFPSPVAEGSDQENILQCVLHLRRNETVHEGLRWFDIKRYGIEIGHNIAGGTTDVLKADDPRRAIQLPGNVIAAGLPANPRN